MNESEIDKISKLLKAAKIAESAAKEERISLEAQILSMVPFNENKKTQYFNDNKLKIVGRVTKKIDPEKLQEIVNEHDVRQYLRILFKWTPTIIESEWDLTPDNIKSIISKAITTKPGKPTITIIEEK